MMDWQPISTAPFDRDLLAKAETLDLGARVFDLLLGQRHAGDVGAVMLGRMAGERAPAATDVEQRVVLLKAELAADDVELLALRDVEIFERMAKRRDTARFLRTWKRRLATAARFVRPAKRTHTVDFLRR